MHEKYFLKFSSYFLLCMRELSHDSWRVEILLVLYVGTQQMYRVVHDGSSSVRSNAVCSPCAHNGMARPQVHQVSLSQI